MTWPFNQQFSRSVQNAAARRLVTVSRRNITAWTPEAAKQGQNLPANAEPFFVYPGPRVWVNPVLTVPFLFASWAIIKGSIGSAKYPTLADIHPTVPQFSALDRSVPLDQSVVDLVNDAEVIDAFTHNKASLKESFLARKPAQY